VGLSVSIELFSVHPAFSDDERPWYWVGMAVFWAVFGSRAAIAAWRSTRRLVEQLASALTDAL
jgi:hypothetical protein